MTICQPTTGGKITRITYNDIHCLAKTIQEFQTLSLSLSLCLCLYLFLSLSLSLSLPPPLSLSLSLSLSLTPSPLLSSFPSLSFLYPLLIYLQHTLQVHVHVYTCALFGVRCWWVRQHHFLHETATWGPWCTQCLLYSSMCVCVCVCMCERERGESILIKPKGKALNWSNNADTVLPPPIRIPVEQHTTSWMPNATHQTLCSGLHRQHTYTHNSKD